MQWLAVLHSPFSKKDARISARVMQERFSETFYHNVCPSRCALEIVSTWVGCSLRPSTINVCASCCLQHIPDFSSRAAHLWLKDGETGKGCPVQKDDIVC
jgi:hypothetical protein